MLWTAGSTASVSVLVIIMLIVISSSKWVPRRSLATGHRHLSNDYSFRASGPDVSLRATRAGQDVVAGHRVDRAYPAPWLRGGRPGFRACLACLGNRPASASARRNRKSIWAFVLRSSSPAHLASASCTAGSSRNSTLLRSVTTIPHLPSLVERAGVHDLL